MGQNSSVQEILDYLKNPEVWSRVEERINLIPAEVRTTIGQAAKIIGINETKLRYWEEKGGILLSPERTRSGSEAPKAQGQRLYSIDELKRLVLIKELLDKDYPLTDITAFIQQADHLFENVVELVNPESSQVSNLSILARISRIEHAPFWRFFVPRALYLTLSLLFEGSFNGDIGVFLPVERFGTNQKPLRARDPEELAALGKTLLGWRQRDYPFYTFLYPHGIVPDYPERFTLISLDELAPMDAVTNAYVVVEHRIAHLSRKSGLKALRSAQRLLQLLQHHTSDWDALLEKGTDYMVYHSPSFTTPSLGDPSLAEMAEVILNLGGTKIKEGKEERRWRFCCFLFPKDPSIPMHRRNLIVKAQSKTSPHKPGTTLSGGPQSSLSQRAYQSGHIIYRPDITAQDFTIASREHEEPIGSAIAIPIAGLDGQPIAVLYIVSEDHDAFCKEDQILLRAIERMVGELALTYDARQLLSEDVKEMIDHPGIVDPFFKDFASENDFMEQLEGQLKQIGLSKQPLFNDLSFIAIDLDNQTIISDKFGDWAARDLVRVVGQRIQGQTRALSKTPEDIQLYRIFGDRFYLVLRNITREKSIELANELCRSLKQPYQITITRTSPEQPILPSNMLNLRMITARLGVTSYSFNTLKSLLERDPVIASVRAKITRALDETLDLGKGRGGDTVIVWDPSLGLTPWQPSP